ncbi:MAG: GntR family transcriptional regulator [Peptostreptococcaceae bacterium]
MDEPIYKTIENNIKEQINSGELKEGDLIPSENELCQTFDVTRMTVRSALNNLVKEGYITRRRGVGSIVIANKIYDNISAISGFTREMKAKGLDVSNIVVSLEVEQANKELASKLNVSVNDNIWVIKRIRLANDIRMSYMITYMPLAMFPNLTKEDCAGSLYEFVENTSRMKISISERQVEAIISNKELQKLLDIEENQALLCIKQVCRLENGQIFEYSHTYHHGYTLTLNAVSN